MRILLCFTLYFGLCISGIKVKAQDTVIIDSLNRMYNEATADTMRVWQLACLVGQYSEISDTSIVIGEKGLELARKIGFKKGEAFCLRAIGYRYLVKEDYERALEYFLTTLSIGEEISNFREIGHACNYLGMLYLYQDDLDRAEAYSNRAVTIMKKNGDTANAYRFSDNLAHIFMLQEKYPEALEMLKEQLEVEKLHDSKYGMACSYGNMGAVYDEMGQSEKALAHYKKALAMGKEINNHRIVSETMMLMVWFFKSMNNDVLCMAYSDSALAIAEKTGNPNVVWDVSECLAELYEEDHDYTSALHYYKKGYQLKDSLYNIERAKALNDIKSEYEIQKREAKIEKLKLEKSNAYKHYIILIGICIGSLLVLILTYKSSIRRKKINLQLEKQKREIEGQALLLKEANERMEKKVIARTQELEMERRKSVKALMVGQESERRRIAQDLHDSLSIRLIGLKRGIESTISDLNNKLINETDSIIQQMREISHNLLPYSLKHLGLFKAIEDLCSTVGEQHDIHVNFNISNIPEDLKLDSVIENETFRIVQEAVANVLKHASANNIEIEIIGGDDLIYLTIEDDGKGFDPKVIKNNGIGLKNMEARANLLGGSLSIDSEPGMGTTVLLNIPKQA